MTGFLVGLAVTVAACAATVLVQRHRVRRIDRPLRYRIDFDREVGPPR